MGYVSVVTIAMLSLFMNRALGADDIHIEKITKLRHPNGDMEIICSGTAKLEVGGHLICDVKNGIYVLDSFDPGAFFSEQSFGGSNEKKWIPQPQALVDMKRSESLKKLVKVPKNIEIRFSCSLGIIGEIRKYKAGTSVFEEFVKGSRLRIGLLIWDEKRVKSRKIMSNELPNPFIEVVP